MYKVVACGGGHGLYASLSALRLLTEEITAVVTVADDGGSSGRLREEFGVLPPGDLRMALSALCSSSQWGTTWRDVLQHRFSSAGPLNGHALGNLLILALWEKFDNTIEALDWVGKLLNMRGRVVPMSPIPLQIEADTRTAEGMDVTVRGQVAVALTRDHVERVRLIPEDPPVEPEARSAIEEADWVILGPGSWYTSVMPHLLVPGLKEALATTKAKKMLVLNLQAEKETRGLSSSDHIEYFFKHAPHMPIDVILADPSSVDDMEALRKVAQAQGAQLLLRTVRMNDGSARHDPLLLASAYRDAFEQRGYHTQFEG